MIKNVFGASIKCLISDNGCEFFNSQMIDLLISLGILHQSSCVYTPQQNGIVERKHRHILDTARSLRFQSHVPMKFWGEYVLTSVYLINRLPSTILKSKTLFEYMYHSAPSLKHLRVFGYLAYATEVRRVDKFTLRAIPAVFLGYLHLEKGYKLMALHTKEFLVSRDVVFKENVFLFQHISPFSHIFSPPLFHDSTNAQYVPLGIPASSSSTTVDHLVPGLILSSVLVISLLEPATVESTELLPSSHTRRTSTKQTRPPPI